MSLPHALLGLLNYRPATGYELKAAFRNSIYFFWDSTLPQIYRTLIRMESKGWLSFTVEHQDGKPSRKVYTLTDSGRQEFRRWLDNPIEMPPKHHPELVKIFFGNQASSERVRTHFLDLRQHHLDLLDKYEKEVMPVIEGYEPLIGPEEARYWRLTLDCGQRFARMMVEWCDQALTGIEKPVETAEGAPPSPAPASTARDRGTS